MTVLTSTAAVIVTFNRAAKLMNVLDALARQTVQPDIIFVIDNASTDDTRERVSEKAMKEPAIRYIRLPKNVGGAGGFHAGIKAAYEAGVQYMWISDDDAYPKPDAIEKLLDAIITFEEDNEWRPSFACSRVEWVDATMCEMNTPETVWDWPRFMSPQKPWALVRSCSFVSVLIPRWAVAKHGLPISDYFIWFDDAEYTNRLSKSYPGIFVPESIVVHDTPENNGVNFGLITDKNLWKYKYGVRNQTSYRQRESGLTGVIGFALGVRRQMKGGNVSGKSRRIIYREIVKGWFFRPRIDKV